MLGTDISEYFFPLNVKSLGPLGTCQDSFVARIVDAMDRSKCEKQP